MTYLYLEDGKVGLVKYNFDLKRYYIVIGILYLLFFPENLYNRSEVIRMT